MSFTDDLQRSIERGISNLNRYVNNLSLGEQIAWFSIILGVALIITSLFLF